MEREKAKEFDEDNTRQSNDTNSGNEGIDGITIPSPLERARERLIPSPLERARERLIPSPLERARERLSERPGYQTANCTNYVLLRDFAKANRKNPTDAENIIWNYLRAKRLGYKFRRQHPVGDFIPDFVCLPLKLIIEIDGGYHFNENMPEEDKRRTTILQSYGYSILRFTNNEVIGDIDAVIKQIKEKMEDLEKVYETNKDLHKDLGNVSDSDKEGLSGIDEPLIPSPSERARERLVLPPSEGARGRLLIFSAPSGSGKSTIVSFLMKEHPELNLAFSISATTRAPRGTEKNGVEYIFLTEEEFRKKIANNEFLEYEEVYPGRFYGTLKEQVETQTAKGENVVFDVDVKGGCNIKKHYGQRALSIFIQPPSIDELRRRLVGRATDAPEVIEQRLSKASYELTFADKFDKVIVNDDLEKAEAETLKEVSSFLRPLPSPPQRGGE